MMAMVETTTATLHPAELMGALSRPWDGRAKDIDA